MRKEEGEILLHFKLFVFFFFLEEILSSCFIQQL